MCKCFCCGAEVNGADMVAVPFLRVVVCRKCELESFAGQNKLPRPDYGQTWAKQMDREFERRKQLEPYRARLDG